MAACLCRRYIFMEVDTSPLYEVNFVDNATATLILHLQDRDRGTDTCSEKQDPRWRTLRCQSPLLRSINTSFKSWLLFSLTNVRATYSFVCRRSTFICKEGSHSCQVSFPLPLPDVWIDGFVERRASIQRCFVHNAAKKCLQPLTTVRAEGWPKKVWPNDNGLYLFGFILWMGSNVILRWALPPVSCNVPWDCQ